MKLLNFILPGLLCIASLGQAHDFNADSALPLDVTAFTERRDLCDHFRGEDTYDKERAEFLAKGMKKTCTGTDKELAALKKKYSNNGSVLKVLADYEDKIEWGD